MTAMRRASMTGSCALPAATARVLYVSRPPKDRSFDPAAIAAAGLADSRRSTARQVPLRGRAGDARGRLTLVQVPGGARYLVETGAPMDDVQAHLRQWLMFLVVGASGRGGWWPSAAALSW